MLTFRALVNLYAQGFQRMSIIRAAKHLHQLE